jgi:hypothetical protein
MPHRIHIRQPSLNNRNEFKYEYDRNEFAMLGSVRISRKTTEVVYVRDKTDRSKQFPHFL